MEHKTDISRRCELACNTIADTGILHELERLYAQKWLLTDCTEHMIAKYIRKAHVVISDLLMMLEQRIEELKPRPSEEEEERYFVSKRKSELAELIAETVKAMEKK